MSPLQPFNFARTPHIIFGPGTFARIGEIAARFGRNVLFLTGGSSFRKSERWIPFVKSLAEKALSFSHIQVSGEPSPALIDAITAEFYSRGVTVVCAIGGGSVIDAGKAVAAMLPYGGPIADFLEGVGTRRHDGRKVPFVAVPTTAGTGSEATKNAVISNVAANGYKKSLRHDNFVPDIALIDPELALSCPPDITAACGMDAFTQLLEAYVSPASSPFTDALVYTGLQQVKDCLIPASTDRARAVEMRTGMAYAALISGIALANAGLGIVHGLASPIGGFFTIPHGVVCGTLIGAATKITIEAMQQRFPHSPALQKYSCVGMLLSGNYSVQGDEGCKLLIDVLTRWTDQLSMPKLGAFGITENDIPKIIEKTSCKTNPIELTKEEIGKILRERL
jgi:alcohol dehydrogenase